MHCFCLPGRYPATMKPILLFALCLLPLLAPATTLRIEGERVWLSGDGAPLIEVLTQFQRCGVDVFIDPSFGEKAVDERWENAPVDRVLAQLASPYSYLLEWEVVNSPLGRMERLSAIRIFTPGRESAVQRLSSGRVLDVVEKNGLKYVRGEILVGFKEGATEDDLNALLKKLGGSLIEVIDPPGIYRIKIGDNLSVEEALALAEAMKMVESAEPNLAFSQLNNIQLGKLSGIGGLNQNLTVAEGSGIIAVFDSGLSTEYAGASYIKGTYNAVDPAAAMSDPSGHGTLTSLIAAGAVTPLGVEDPGGASSVVSVRVFDENGMTSSDTLMRALQYAADSGASIVSMSWGTEVDSSFIETAMNFAAANGMTLIASAGNENTGEAVYPAALDSVIGVGGLNPDGTVWENSNSGESVDIYEPAFAVLDGQTYVGTSIGSPYAAHKLSVATKTAEGE